MPSWPGMCRRYLGLRGIGDVDDRGAVRLGFAGLRIDRRGNVVGAAVMADIGDPALALVMDGRLVGAARLQIVGADEAHVGRFRRRADFLRLRHLQLQRAGEKPARYASRTQAVMFPPIRVLSRSTPAFAKDIIARRPADCTTLQRSRPETRCFEGGTMSPHHLRGMSRRRLLQFLAASPLASRRRPRRGACLVRSRAMGAAGSRQTDHRSEKGARRVRLRTRHEEERSAGAFRLHGDRRQRRCDLARQSRGFCANWRCGRGGWSMSARST